MTPPLLQLSKLSPREAAGVTQQGRGRTGILSPGRRAEGGRSDHAVKAVTEPTDTPACVQLTVQSERNERRKK